MSPDENYSGSDFGTLAATPRYQSWIFERIQLRLSGTNALNSAVRALDLGLGDEVITVDNTWISTAFAATLTGALPSPRSSRMTVGKSCRDPK